VDKAHKRLETWQQSMLLVKTVYEITDVFPKGEMFGLISQMRRAAVSVPSNIAEGVARGGSKEYVHFLNIARGSLSELDTQLEIARMLDYLPASHAVFTQIETVGRLLTGLHRKISELK
jgi:four helix bundle protein